MKYVIVKYDTKPDAKSYDDIKEDKYLGTFLFDWGESYPLKSWTKLIENAIKFPNKEIAEAIINILSYNSPYPMKVESYN